MILPTLPCLLLLATGILTSSLSVMPAKAFTTLKPGLSVATSSSQVLPAHRIVSEVQSTESAVQTRADRLVIFFHGIRGRGSVMDAIGRSWRTTLPDTAFAAPDAPFAHRSGGRQWFAVDDQVLRPERIQAARDAFDKLVTDIIAREGFEGRLDEVAFVGVSQGAIMALDAVSSGRWKVGALISFAGLLPLPPTAASSKTPVLLMHGGADRTIPSAASVAASSQLQSAGYDVTLKLFPTVGHTISAEQASEAAAFLRDRFE